MADNNNGSTSVLSPIGSATPTVETAPKGKGKGKPTTDQAFALMRADHQGTVAAKRITAAIKATRAKLRRGAISRTDLDGVIEAILSLNAPAATIRGMGTGVTATGGATQADCLDAITGTREGATRLKNSRTAYKGRFAD